MILNEIYCRQQLLNARGFKRATEMLKGWQAIGEADSEENAATKSEYELKTMRIM